MFSVNKEFTIDYAHRLLLPYESLCNNLHGHTGKIILSLSLNEVNKEQMLIDFNELKIFINKIKNKYDHSTLINEKDEDLLNFCQSHDYKYVTFNGNPTSENIAKELAYNLYYEYNKLLKDKTWIINVTFYETPTASAEYTLLPKQLNIEDDEKKAETIKKRKEYSKDYYKERLKNRYHPKKNENDDDENNRKNVKNPMSFIKKIQEQRNKKEKNKNEPWVPYKKRVPWDRNIICKICPESDISEQETIKVLNWANKINSDDFEQIMEAIKNAPKFIQDAARVQIQIKTND